MLTNVAAGGNDVPVGTLFWALAAALLGPRLMVAPMVAHPGESDAGGHRCCLRRRVVHRGALRVRAVAHRLVGTIAPV
jgi:hypothetical protein